MSIPFIKASTHKNSDGTYTVKVYHREGVVTEVHFANAAFAPRMAQQYADFMNDAAEEVRKFETYMKEPTYEEPKPEELRAQAISFAMANVNLDREEKGEEPIAQEVFEKAYDELHPKENPVVTFPDGSEYDFAKSAPVTEQTTVMGADVSTTKDEATVSITTFTVQGVDPVTNEPVTEPITIKAESKEEVEQYIGELVENVPGVVTETPVEAPIGDVATDIEGPQETTTETPGFLNEEQAEAAQEAFDATPEQLGEAAVNAASKKKGKRK